MRSDALPRAPGRHRGSGRANQMPGQQPPVGGASHRALRSVAVIGIGSMRPRERRRSAGRRLGGAGRRNAGLLTGAFPLVLSSTADGARQGTDPPWPTSHRPRRGYRRVLASLGHRPSHDPGLARRPRAHINGRRVPWQAPAPRGAPRSSAGDRVSRIGGPAGGLATTQLDIPSAASAHSRSLTASRLGRPQVPAPPRSATMPPLGAGAHRDRPSRPPT